LSRFLYKFFFTLFGWKINGKMPAEKKFIIIVAPHTSNWDFMIGLAVRSILKFKARYLAKKELFRFPFGTFFRALGGVPVDRSKNSNLVESVAELFRERDELIIAIAPEGTRKQVTKWKTGFYFIALEAHIPIVMASFDYKRKTVFINKPFYPTGNKEEDMKYIFDFYLDKRGKYPKEIPQQASS
jgi:1-acyl-sn-glycerol-3-phosphate acyltransferase